jgi:hypothetical protein
MSLHLDLLLRFRANQSLHFLLNAACLAEKQQIPILLRGSNPRSTALEASTTRYEKRETQVIKDFFIQPTCIIII